MSSETRHGHTSGVVPVGEYQPGARLVGPSISGVRAVPAENFPKPRRPRRPPRESPYRSDLGKPKRKEPPRGPLNAG